MLELRHPHGARLLDRAALEQWMNSPQGMRLRALEAQELQRLVPDIFGRHLLQIGSWSLDASFLQGAETLHRAVLGTVTDGSAAAIVDPLQLPLPAKSIDAVILPHTLEFSESPHAVLREVARVLNDRGRLFLLGFSPWGLRAWRNRLGLRGRHFPPHAHFYGARRVGDWLQLLDCEIADLRRFGTGFPWLDSRSSLQPWSPQALLAPLAEAYLLIARKRVLPVNLIGRAQRAQVRPLVGVAAPAAQRQNIDGDANPTPP